MLFTYTKTQELKLPLRFRGGCDTTPCRATQTARVRYLALEVFELPCLLLSIDKQANCEQCPHLEDRQPNVLSQLYSVFMTVSLLARMNIGSILLVLSMLWVAGQYHGAQQQKQQYLQSPMINDFYFVDINHWRPDNHPFYRYTALKVVNVESAMVEVQIGNMMHDEQVSARDHISYDKAMYRGFFTRKTMHIPIAELTQLYQQDVIYDVRRPRNLFIDGSIVVSKAVPDDIAAEKEQ